MPGLDTIPAELQGIGTAIFLVFLAAFAAWSRIFGKKEGPPQPKVQEFYASGALTDMGPVKELVEQLGLLIMQQIKSNMHSEETAKAIMRLCDAYEHRMDEEQRDREIAEEVRRQLGTPR